MGRQVVWAALLAGVLALPSAVAAQDRQIAGTVTRSNGGQPVGEATVAAVGGRGAARTNSEGKYTITVGPGDVRLAVRAIGFQRREVIVPAGQTTLNVSLTEDVFKLEEVVITGQSTTLEKRNATTANSTVDNADITRAPAQSLEQGLQGKVLGASINLNSGAPGGGGQIQIRGVTSILGNGQPLFIVDGIIVSNDGFSSGANTVTGAGGGATATAQDAVVNRLADINPQEIESIEILKSAAATAIYGSRATNGVVVIKTKRGAPGQARFNLTQRVGVASPLKLLGARVWTSVDDVINDAGVADYFGGRLPSDPIFANFPGGVITAAQNRDLQENFFSNRKPSYETTANISGGSESLQYFVGATNRQEVGLADRTGARLQSIRANVDQSWSSKFKTSVSLNITRNVLNRGLSNNDNTFTSPIYAFGYTPSIFDLDRRDPVTGAFRENPLNGGGNAASNPFQTFEFLKVTEDVFRQTGSATQFFIPVANDKNTVTFSVVGGFDRFQQIGDVVSPGFLQYEGGADGFVGRATKSSINVLNYNIQGSGSWTYNASKASFTTSAGASYERQGAETLRLRSRGILPGTTTSGQGTIDGSNGFNEFRDQALFANEQILALNNKLAINAGVRADRSSANGDVSKFYVFPRASASYNVDNIGAIDNVKFRAGYGETGNRPRFADRDVTLATGSVIGGSPSVVTAGLVGNIGIRPETLKEFEGGVDVTLFNQKVQLEATGYSRRITNQLLQPQVAPSTGVSNLIVNAGRLKNEGVELGLTFVPVNSTDLQWQARTTFQKNVQRVVDLPNTIPPFPVPGSFGAAFGRNRIANGQLTTAIWGNAPVDANGAYLPVGIYVTNPGAVVARRDTIIGDANPDFQMFFNNSLTYKRVTLGFTWDWRKGGDVSSLTQLLYDEGGNSRDFVTPITSADQINRAGVPGGQVSAADAAASAFPRLGDFRYAAWNGGQDARAYILDGSFVRLRDVSLSYDAPRAVAASVGARSLRVNLQGRNLLLFSKFWSFDPEFNNFGNTNLNRFIDLAPFPGARQFAVSVDVGF